MKILQGFLDATFLQLSSTIQGKCFSPAKVTLKWEFFSKIIDK